MMDTHPILDSQHQPPNMKDAIINRSHLQRLLQTITQYPLTIIHSGAGYGKSIGLSQFVHTSNQYMCWYSVSKYDEDLIPFLTKLIYAIQTAHPGFGDEVIEALTETKGRIYDQDVWRLMTVTVNACIELETPTTIIVDDAHHLMQSKTVIHWLELFIEHIPDNLHIVLSARYKPRWGILSQLKVKGALLEINQSDLAFSLDEFEHLIVDLYGVNLEKHQIETLYHHTEGWPIACVMMGQQIKQGDPTKNLDHHQQAMHSDLFEYMDYEILSKQPFMIQKFLEQTSVLDVMSVEACDVILGMGGSQQILENLLKQNLFIHKLDDEHYRYHYLFKEFLIKRLKANAFDEYEQLNRKAARHFEDTRDFEAAIVHHQNVFAHERVTQLIEDHGKRMLEEGKLEQLQTILDKIPYQIRQSSPLLWFLTGEILRYRSKYEEAEKVYIQAIKVAENLKQNYVISLAYEGKAKIYLDTIRPVKAKRILEQAISYREKLEVEEAELARLYYMLGENLLNSGSAKKAESWLDQAKSANLPVDDVNLEARIYLRTGRLVKAKQYLTHKKEQLTDEANLKLPKSHRETDILLSIICAFMGEAEEAKYYAELGLQQGVENDSPFVEACGWMRIGHASQLLARYDDETISSCYHQALEIMKKLNVSRGMAEPYMGLCILYGNQGQYEQAYEAGQKGLLETEKVSDPWLSALILLCLGISATYCQRHERAYEFLLDAKDHFERCEDDHGLMLVNFWQAYLAYYTQNNPLFCQSMKRFLTLLQTGNYEYFLKYRTLCGPNDLQSIAPLLQSALENDLQRSYIIRLIHELGFAQLENHPGYTLTIKTLGSFQVKTGNQVISGRHWQREKAKELLELLVTKRNRVLTKEEIFENLWPGEVEESANKKFKVALNSLLKVLEPGRKVRQESYFIERQGSTYRLNPKAGYKLDLDDFEAYVQAGLEEDNPEKAKELLLKGLTIYEGDYIAPRRTTDWIMSERERIQVLFLKGAEKLAQISTRLEEYDRCLYWCDQILQQDRTWEEAYRLMMYSYYRLNNRPQAIKWYKRCEEVLEKELDLDPTQATKDMYELIK
ncbi:BTAD domain-containing putative transcriptional regulator [Alkalibacillus aidingensis]|uniref:BTAD domain-containing putative transcriptional regulator n=1 Tax=Alkalibacillus aidingensis TaxID=2747607 RepID=UPI001660D6AA|nr:BTAD domain-containing putative transcriptional regulator [Alkalibacillus aidingensis]